MLKQMVVALVAACAAIGTAHAQTRYDRGLEMRAIAIGLDARVAGVYVPSSYRQGTPAPLIVALHGRFSSGQAFHAISGLAAVAEARGAILLYPEALGGFWNDGGFGRNRQFGTEADDLGFIREAIASVSADYAVDASRIFLVGYDFGGQLGYRLMCEGDVRFAGVAAVSAATWDFTRDGCANARQPAPLLIVHGRRDEYVPVNGGEPQGEYQRLNVDQANAFWRRTLGCGDRAASTGRDDSAFFNNCRNGAFAYVGVAGGEHDWFHTGGAYKLNMQGVDATALVDRFFFDRANFSLPEARSRGRARSWLVYAPPNYDPAQPTPVVVLLHGRPSNATGMALITQMNDVADRHGFIVVYPNGIDNEWNAQFDIAGNTLSLTGQRATLPQDDVGFLEDLVSDLGQDLNIDRTRMYVGGFSNGGFMTQRMACSASDTFAAFGSVGSGLYVELARYCQRTPATPILIMHGTGDRSVQYEGVQIANPQGGDPVRITLGAQETVSTFARRNGCSLRGESTTFAEGGESPGTHVVRFLPYECDEGADVAFYIINGGGHNWPGVKGILPEENFGPTNMDINAGEVLWDFFSRHRLAPTG